MPVFNYVAIKNGKETVNGKIEAADLKEARESLRNMDLLPTKIEIQQVSGILEQKAKSGSRAKLNKLKMRDKIDFTNTLYILSKTGISLVEALFFIELNSASKNVRKLSAELRKHVLAGATLSEAVDKYPEIFDTIYTGLIKAGEESGELDTTLNRMVELLEKQEGLISEVKAAMTYPAIVSFIAAAVTTLMLTFVFPKFKEIYDGLGVPMPMITQVLMNIGVFLQTHWYCIPLIFGAVIGGIIYLLKWPVSKRIIDTILLKIPVVNNFVILSVIANFVAVLKVAFDAGVPIVNSLLLANLTINNYLMRDSIKSAATKVQQGHSISNALKATEHIPGIVMCMISTGEQSGQLGDMLGLASEYIDTQLDRVVKSLNKLIEPVMLIVIGCIVLVLALALYLPLFQSYSHIG